MPADVEVPETEETSDLRSDLVAAMEQAEAPPTPPVESGPPPAVETAPETPAPEGETPEQKSERLRDEKGRFAKATEDKPVLTPSEKAEQAGIKPTPIAPEKAAPAPTPQTEPAKAPASFKAMAREEWGKVPPAVQQEVLRRERETAMALEQSSEARQGYQRFKEVVGPYEAMIRGQGSDPYQTVQSLLQTAAALATAPLQQRAQVLAGLIKTYLPGRESLEVLDQTLAGVMQGQPAQSAPPQYRDPRVDEIYETIQQAKQRQAATLEQQAMEGIRSIQGEEFYEDVRLIVADMLEVAGNQGIALTPSEAYNRAVLVHPEVSKVVEQRQRQKLAANPSGSMARARAAASSVRASPATAPTSAVQPDDLRSVLESAFDRAGR
jgi:hypothetical protein